MLQIIETVLLVCCAVLVVGLVCIILSGAFPPGERKARQALMFIAKDSTLPIDDRLKAAKELKTI